MSSSLPKGVVVERPDACYLHLVDLEMPANLFEGVVSASAANSVLGYMAAEAVRLKEAKEPPDAPIIIGNSHAQAVVSEAVDEAVDAYDAAQRPLGAPYQGFAWDLLVRLLREKVRDPAVMDVGAHALARVI